MSLYQIKPTTWQEPTAEYYAARMNTAFGIYWAWRSGWTGPNVAGELPADSREAAKAACEADYLARLLTALTPAPTVEAKGSAAKQAGEAIP